MAVTKIIRRVEVKRSRWFRLWALCLFVFNAYMVLDIWIIWSRLSALRAKTTNGIEHLTLSVLGANKLQELVILWLAGAVVFAALMWFARGTRQIIEEHHAEQSTPLATAPRLMHPVQLPQSPATLTMQRMRDEARKTTPP